MYSMIREVKPLLEECNFKDIFEIIEANELNFSLKLLKCHFLEKRLKGMNELREFIDNFLEFK